MRLEILIADAGERLRSIGIHNGPQEARWMLRHVLGAGSSRLAGGPAAGLTPAAVAAFEALLQRRLAGEPLQYVLGSAEFYGLELSVGPGVLVPRPETERLVDFALEHCVPGAGLCDVCTGSGAIALALAHERPDLGEVVGTDLSPTALGYARRNAERLGLAVQFLEGDLFGPLPPGRRFGVITANPPYIDPVSYEALAGEVRDHEPRLALWADDGGLAVVSRVAREGFGRLRPGGVLLCEISAEQGAAAAALFRSAGFVSVEVRQDYAGRDRVVVARRVV